MLGNVILKVCKNSQLFSWQEQNKLLNKNLNLYPIVGIKITPT